MTQAQFREWEASQSVKHEFVAGAIFAFAGATSEHNAIVTYLLTRIAPAVPTCRAYAADMLVETAASSRYPDISVSCDAADTARGSRAFRRPKLIIEVLSMSTADDDLGPKLREYLTLASLEEYAIFDSRRTLAQSYVREGDRWLVVPPVPSGLFSLASIGLTVDLDDLYRYAGLLD